MNPSQRLLASCRVHLDAAPRLWIAFSGGLDSTVLLHSLASTLPVDKLLAVHVNHGLSPHSDSWLLHCRDTCQRFGVEFIARDVTVDRGESSLEQAARRARYQVFEDILETEDLLLTAHHLDDQVETALFRLLRGSAPRGLAGIPQRRPLGRGSLLRPLLDVPRSELEAYARDQDLQWIDDESNEKADFDRNYLRHHVLPVLAGRWPAYRQRIDRSAAQCRSAASVLEEVGLTDLQALEERREVLGHSLSLAEFAALSRPRRGNLLREWTALRRRGTPPHGVYEEVLDALVAARHDRQPRVTWRDGEFRRFRQRLYLLPPLADIETVETAPLSFSGDMQPIQLPDGSWLLPSRGEGRNALALAPGEKVTLAYRRGGEYCHPVDRSGGASLKKIFNERGVPPWLRGRLPLLYIDGELAAVPGLFVCRDYCCEQGEQGISLAWEVGEAQFFRFGN